MSTCLIGKKRIKGFKTILHYSISFVYSSQSTESCEIDLLALDFDEYEDGSRSIVLRLGLGKIPADDSIPTTSSAAPGRPSFEFDVVSVVVRGQVLTYDCS